MKNEIIIEARKRALKNVTLSISKRYEIQKNFETGKLLIKPKEPVMKTSCNTNYLEYDTRTV